MATINLTNGDDDFSDNNAGNRIKALAGDDAVRGNGGNDQIGGGLGADTLQGGTGDDRLVDNASEDEFLTNRLFGGPGDDRLDGGTVENVGVIEAFGGDGDDRLVAGDFITVARGGAGDDLIDAFLSFEGEVSGDDGNDTLDVVLVEAASFEINGGAGRDRITIDGTEGGGSANGGDGNDVVDARQVQGDFGSTYSGGAGDDTVYGSNSFPFEEPIVLIGGPGTDRLVGNDTPTEFRFAAGDLRSYGNRDVVAGFDPDRDVIDVSPIDAFPADDKNQAFDFIGESRSVDVGELAYARSGADTIVRLNFGNGVRAIELEGFAGPLSGDDFVL